MAGRVTAQFLEVIRNVVAPARVTSQLVEVVRPDDPAEEFVVTGAAVAVAHSEVEPPEMVITQVGVEALVGGVSVGDDVGPQITQEGAEVLSGGAAAPEVTQEGVEVIYKATFAGCDTRPVYYRVRFRLIGEGTDLAVYTSLPTGANSVLAAEPKIDAATVDVLRGATTVGACTLLLVDAAERTSGFAFDETNRAFTSILADVAAQAQVLGLRVFVEATENPVPDEIDWGAYWAGYVAKVSFPDAITAEVSCAHTTRDDETTMVWKTRVGGHLNTGFVMGGPALTDFPASTPAIRATGQESNGLWSAKVVGVYGTYVKLDINEDTSQPFPPADLKPYLRDRGLIRLNNNDEQRNVFAWVKRNVQPYYVEGAPDETIKTAWNAAGIYGWYPRLEFGAVSKNGMAFTGTFPVMASFPQLTSPLGNLDYATITADLGNNFHLYWPSGGAIAQPVVDDILSFRVRAIDISPANPLLILQHPVDILTTLWDALEIDYDAAAAASTKAALGDFVLALRITEPMTLKAAQEMVCGAFGLAWRFDPNGDRVLFTTRVRPTASGTIKLADLRSDDGVIWETDEGSRVFSVSYEWKRFVAWPGQEDAANADRALDGVQPYPIGPIVFNTGETDKPYGARDEAYKVEGTVMVTGGTGTYPYLEANATEVTARLSAPLLEQFARGGIQSTLDLGPDVVALEGQDWWLELPHRPGFDDALTPVAQRGLVERVQVIARTPHAWGSTVTVVRVPQTADVIDSGLGSPTATVPTIDGTVATTPSSTTLSLALTNDTGHLAVGALVEVEYAVTSVAPTGSGLAAPYLWNPDDGAFILGPFTPGSEVYYRTRTVYSDGTRAAFGAWASDTLTAGTGQVVGGAGMQTPTIVLSVDGSFNVSATVEGGPSATKAYCVGSSSAYPDSATVLLATPDTTPPFTFATVVATLAAGATAYVSAITEDALGNRSVIAVAAYQRPSAGGNSFGKIVVAGQSDVDADAATGTLELVAGSNITITTDAGTDKVTIASTASGGGGVYAGAMREIATVTTTGSQATVTFSAIPSTYRDLLVVLSGRSTAGVTAASLLATFNGDSGANYSFVRENRFGPTSSLASTYMEIGSLSGASTASYISTVNFWIRDYASTGKWRPSMAQSSLVDGTAVVHQQASGWWENTANPVTSVSFALASGNFEDGSTVTLYGIGGEVGGAALNPIYTKYDPFCPPVAPSAIDDEFTIEGSGVPVGWTEVGALTGGYSTAKRRLLMTAPSSGGSASAAAIERVLPFSSVFSVVCNVTSLTTTTFNCAGIYVRNTTSGLIKANRMFTNSTNIGDKWVNGENFTSFSSRSSVTSQIQHIIQNPWLRIRSDGTTMFLDISADGVDWINYHSESLAGYFSGGNLPNRAGIMLGPFSGNPSVAAFRAFRCFPSSNADIGRNVGVGSDGSFVDPLALLLHNKVI